MSKKFFHFKDISFNIYNFKRYFDLNQIRDNIKKFNKIKFNINSEINESKNNITKININKSNFKTDRIKTYKKLDKNKNIYHSHDNLRIFTNSNFLENKKKTIKKIKINESNLSNIFIHSNKNNNDKKKINIFPKLLFNNEMLVNVFKKEEKKKNK